MEQVKKTKISLNEIKKRQKRVLTEEKQGSIMNSESADS